jgi:glycosyltransferase involved in cell wall biosynthesis
LKIVQITTDSRVHYGEYVRDEPYFGTAPAALLQGFRSMPEEVDVHVISVSRRQMATPAKLAPNIHFHQPLVSQWGMGRSLFAGAILAVRKSIREINPDIVHGQGTERECALAAAFSGYPNVLTLHGNMRVHAKRGENKGKPYYRLAAFLEGIALRKTDGVVSISTYTDKLVKPLARKTWLLPNAADSRYFEAIHKPSEPLTVLFVGGLDERKNPVGFINACAPLFEGSGWKFRLCGTGAKGSAYLAELEALAAKHPWIELAGWKSREDLLAEMEAASLLVLPTFEDNCPMVVLEAMAVGLPVIASRVGGVPDLITDGKTGIMFDPSSPENIREVTGRLMNDPDLRARVGKAGKTEALERFHPKVVAQEHLRIYREVLQERDRMSGIRNRK